MLNVKMINIKFLNVHYESKGNCWFISAATGIIQNYALFKRVVPFENSFEGPLYTGLLYISNSI
jgi:hypothetical protein